MAERIDWRPDDVDVVVPTNGEGAKKGNPVYAVVCSTQRAYYVGGGKPNATTAAAAAASSGLVLVACEQTFRRISA